MIFISDLDKTLVYSKCPGNVCVEYSDGREITYMTPTAVEIFCEIINSGKLIFIPCTLRSYEQTRRIKLLRSMNKQIFICDNGFSIYVNGVLDQEWDKLMRAKLSDYPNEDVLRRIADSIEEYSLPVQKVKDNRGAFYTIIFNDIDCAKNGAQLIDSSIDKELYNFVLQGRKIYIIPKFLDKSLAVSYLLEQYPFELVVTSGDSKVDEKFIGRGDYRILPAHATIQVNDAIFASKPGIGSGEEIIVMIKELLNNIY